MTKTIVLSALLFGVSTAVAQPAPPSPAPAPNTAGMTDDQKKAEAKRLYENGINHYNLGDFDAAITAFRTSYAISAAPGLLFNIAQSFRLKKDYEQATYFYTTYLRLKPEASNRADVEARLKEMKELLDEQKKNEFKPPIGMVGPDGDTKTSTTNPTSTTAPTKEPTVTVNVNTGAPRDTGGGNKSGTLMTAGMATAGAGMALVLTGFVFGKMAKSAESDLNALSTDMGSWGPEQQDRYDAGKRNNTIALISFVAGGAAVATGGTLYVLGMMKKSDASVAIAPTRGGTSVAVGWSF